MGSLPMTVWQLIAKSDLRFGIEGQIRIVTATVEGG